MQESVLSDLSFILLLSVIDTVEAQKNSHHYPFSIQHCAGLFDYNQYMSNVFSTSVGSWWSFMNVFIVLMISDSLIGKIYKKG